MTLTRFMRVETQYVNANLMFPTFELQKCCRKSSILASLDLYAEWREHYLLIGYSPRSAFISLLALNASSTTASCVLVVNFNSTSPTFLAFTSSSAAQT
jgi:hypothetical protein